MSRLSALLAFLLLPIGVTGLSAAEDDDRKIAFNKHCRTCHSIKRDDNRLGPSMYGIFGAKAGQVRGYNSYSGGLAGLTWDAATLDRFIANPTAVSPSTTMISPPVSDAAERAKIIEFLKSIGSR